MCKKGYNRGGNGGLRRYVLFLFVVALLSCGKSVQNVADPVIHSRLYVSDHTVTPGGQFTLALHVTLPSQWYTYWLNPGDAGMPPRVTVVVPEGFSLTSPSYPFPRRFTYGDQTSFGYKDSLVLLYDIVVPEDLGEDRVVNLIAITDLLLCNDICVPLADTVRLEFSVANGVLLPSQGVDLSRITRVRKNVPRIGEIRSVKAHMNKNSVSLQVPFTDGVDVPVSAVFFPIDKNLFNYTGRQELRKDETGFVLSIPFAALRNDPPDSLRGVVVIKNSGGHFSSFELVAPVHNES